MVKFSSAFTLFFITNFLLFSLLYSQDTRYAREVVSVLTSEEFAGRGYVSRGDFKSAKYIRNEFKSNSLQPLNGDWFQAFNLSVNTFPGKMELIADGKSLKPGTDYIADPSCPAFRSELDVHSIKLHQLLDTDILDSILHISAGKALLIDESETVLSDPGKIQEVNKILLRLKYDPGLKHRLTILLTRNKLIWSVSGQKAVRPVFMIHADSAGIDRIDHIDVKCWTRLKRNYKTRNVVGYIPGTVTPDSFLVITAHYDHLGKMGKETIFPGANDNASGIAMMLSLVRYFSEKPLKYSLVFLALSAEEAGLLGAEYFVEHPRFNLENTRFLVNFDLAGTGDEGIKVVNASLYPYEFNHLREINIQYNLMPSVQPRGEACISDHCLFHNKKVPCFYIYTLGGITAYHDIYDRSETLPLTEFSDYFRLMTLFFEKL